MRSKRSRTRSGLKRCKRAKPCRRNPSTEHIGEGQWIIQKLDPPKHAKPLGQIWGCFELTVYQTLNMLQLPLKEKEKIGSSEYGKKRETVSVGKTVEEMERNLPKEWRSVWESYHTNGLAKPE